MADYYAIILDLTTSYFESAAMEMSSSGAGSATFTVYTSGGSSSSGSATFNSDYYVSSQSSSISNLFTPSGRTTALVKATSAVAKGAFLRQWSGSHNIGLFVPPTTVSAGTTFRLPGSNNVTSSKVLIGNTTGSTATVRLYYGNSATPDSTHVIAAHNFTVVDVTQTQKALKITSTYDIIVQVAVLMNSEYDISFVLPT